MMPPAYPSTNPPRPEWYRGLVDYVRSTRLVGGRGYRVKPDAGGTALDIVSHAGGGSGATEAAYPFQVRRVSANSVSVRAGAWLREAAADTHYCLTLVDGPGYADDPDEIATLSTAAFASATVYAYAALYDATPALNATAPTHVRAVLSATAPATADATGFRLVPLAVFETDSDGNISGTIVQLWRGGYIVDHALLVETDEEFRCLEFNSREDDDESALSLFGFTNPLQHLLYVDGTPALEQYDFIPVRKASKQTGLNDGEGDLKWTWVASIGGVIVNNWPGEESVWPPSWPEPWPKSHHSLSAWQNGDPVGSGWCAFDDHGETAGLYKYMLLGDVADYGRNAGPNFLGGVLNLETQLYIEGLGLAADETPSLVSAGGGAFAGDLLISADTPANEEDAALRTAGGIRSDLASGVGLYLTSTSDAVSGSADDVAAHIEGGIIVESASQFGWSPNWISLLDMLGNSGATLAAYASGQEIFLGHSEGAIRIQADSGIGIRIDQGAGYLNVMEAGVYDIDCHGTGKINVPAEGGYCVEGEVYAPTTLVLIDPDGAEHAYEVLGRKL